MIISFDFNSKLGASWRPNDAHGQSPNGQVLAAIDFVIISHDKASHYVSLQVDEAREYYLKSFARTKTGTVTKESYHNSLICKMNQEGQEDREVRHGPEHQDHSQGDGRL